MSCRLSVGSQQSASRSSHPLPVYRCNYGGFVVRISTNWGGSTLLHCMYDAMTTSWLWLPADNEYYILTINQVLPRVSIIITCVPKVQETTCLFLYLIVLTKSRPTHSTAKYLRTFPHLRVPLSPHCKNTPANLVKNSHQAYLFQIMALKTSITHSEPGQREEESFCTSSQTGPHSWGPKASIWTYFSSAESTFL